MSRKSQPASAIHCANCDYIGPALVAHQKLQVYHYALVAMVVGLIPLALLLNSRSLCCPSCGATRNISATEETASPSALALWKEKQKEADDLHRRQSTAMAGVLLLVVVVVLSLVIIFLPELTE